MSRCNSRSKSNRSVFAALLSAAAASVGVASIASADPLPGEQLKFYQSPLNDAPPGIYPVGATPLATDKPAPFPGQDINSTAITTTAGGAQGNMAADDFSDFNTLPIGHVTWWGSYLNDTNPSGAPLVNQFQISLYTNVPGVAGTTQDFSHPGNLIATQTVTQTFTALTPSDGMFIATPVQPGTSGIPGPAGESGLIQYNAELNWQQIPFPDAFNGNIEWLSIVALVPPATTSAPVAWGWHDRDYGIADPLAAPTPEGSETPYPYHYLDDAVTGSYNNGLTGGYVPQLYNPNFDGLDTSMDLAFAIYSVPVPEPATLSFLALATPALLMRRRRTRQ
jgi:hypothetical protein